MPSGEVVIKNGFPFGLADVSQSVDCDKQAIVWPDRQKLQGGPSTEGNHFNLFGSISDQSGNEGETIGVRSYRHGDGLRSIHWAQTARSRQLMVRERQTPSVTSTVVMLDLAADHHAGQGVHSSFEWAIRITASICHQINEMQSRVRVVCLGLPQGERGSASNARGIDSVMDFLACLPTFAALQQLDSGTLQQNIAIPSQSQQAFLVGTLQSAVGFNDDEIHSVLIDTETLTGDETGDQQSLLSAKTMPRNGMVVTAPELAIGQLGFAWNERMDRVG